MPQSPQVRESRCRVFRLKNSSSSRWRSPGAPTDAFKGAEISAHLGSDHRSQLLVGHDADFFNRLGRLCDDSWACPVELMPVKARSRMGMPLHLEEGQHEWADHPPVSGCGSRSAPMLRKTSSSGTPRHEMLDTGVHSPLAESAWRPRPQTAYPVARRLRRRLSDPILGGSPRYRRLR